MFRHQGKKRTAKHNLQIAVVLIRCRNGERYGLFVCGQTNH